MLHAMCGAPGGPQVRLVGRAVVGEDLTDPHATLGEPGNSSSEERDGGRGPFMASTST
jgi:hypothetical protein